MTTIYVKLLDEGVDVWRPVEAALISGQNYLVEGDVPDGEVWEFPPGSVVKCDWKTFTEGERGLTAIEAAGAE